MDVEARATRLKRAARSVESGDYKKALTELWYAEAEHRGEERELQKALSLATAVADKTKGRVGREAETLVSTLKADIGHAKRLPIAAETKLTPDVPEEEPWRGLWAVSLAAINVLGFLIVLASPDDDILPTGFLIGFALWFLGGLGAVIMGIAAVTDMRRSNRRLGIVALAAVLGLFVGLVVFISLGG